VDSSGATLDFLLSAKQAAEAARRFRTLAGYAAVHMLRKGQAFGGSSKGGAVALHAFILSRFGFEG
jgi:hypothetical protein